MDILAQALHSLPGKGMAAAAEEKTAEGYWEHTSFLGGEMFLWRKNHSRLDRYAWMPFDSGYERTRARVLIESALNLLERSQAPLLLKQDLREPVPTTLLGHTDQHLLLDLPLDWKIRSFNPRLLFKDQLHLECYFDTKIFYVRNEIIHARLPDSLIRIQRRAYPRVETPGGAEAAASIEGGETVTFAIRNLSAGGMLCCCSNRILRVGSALDNLELRLPHPSERGKRSRLRFEQGRIVRTCVEAGEFGYGVSFACGDREKRILEGYVRQKRIELSCRSEEPLG